jgi:putative aldouronate transport system substrate-binding protein
MVKKKIVFLFGLIIVLLASLTTACGSGSSEGENAGPVVNNAPNMNVAGEDEEAPTAKHMEISISFPDIGNFIKRDVEDPLLKEIEQRFNITIKPVQVTWEDYREKTNLWAASGQLPDIFFTASTDNSLYKTWVEQGVIRQIPEEVSSYPNLQKLMSTPDVKAHALDGIFYFIPRILTGSNELPEDRTLFVRKDWMEALGYDYGYDNPPPSWSAFMDMLKDMADNNPDGASDVVGLTIKSLGESWGVLYKNIFPEQGFWTEQDGQWLPPELSPNQLAELEAARQLYQSGVLDKDFALPNLDGNAKFAQGKAAAIAHQSKNVGGLETAWNQNEQNIPFEDAVIALPLPPGVDGNQYFTVYYSFWSDSLFNASVSDEKMERIMQLYDFLLSPEGRLLSEYGFEGTDYQMEGDKLKITREMNADGSMPALREKYPSAGLLGDLVVWGYGETYDDHLHPGVSDGAWQIDQDWRNYMYQNGKAYDINWEVNAFVKMLPPIGGAVDINAEKQKIIFGTGDIKKMWDEVIHKLNQTGLQDRIKRVNDEY